MLALRFARRELRGGLRGLGIVVLCLALGVAAIAAVGTLRAATEAGLAANARALLGGDLEIGTGAQPPPPALREWLGARGAQISEVARLRSLLVAPSGERQLIELRGVDAAWPLVGAATLNPAQPIGAALARHDGTWGIAVDPVVLDRLDLHPGETARLGTATVQVRAALLAAPDRVGGPALLGAPVLISLAALPATGLVVPGSLVSYALRVTTPDPTALAAALRAAFPDQGWRVRGPTEAAPGMRRFLEQTALFLTLAGLTSLLVGGIGVANGVRVWLTARARSLAVLRCLGASSRLVLTVCLLQVLALAGLGIVVGMAAGLGLAQAALGWLGGALPVPPGGAVYPGALAVAGLYGLLVTLCFALWPLGRAARVPAGALFRDPLLPEAARPGGFVVAASVTLAAALIALTVSRADHWLALWFCGAALGVLALFHAGGGALMRLARAVPPPRAPALRLGLGNLHRPGAATRLMLVSVGLGLSTLAAVALIGGNLHREITREIPTDAPSFYFIDIQPAQLARFESLVRASPGVRSMVQVPSLRARIVAVNGVPAAEVKATPDTRWALRGDRGLTYAASPPAGTTLVAGAWWPADYHGKPLVSVDAELARGWGLAVGGTIRVNVLGRDIDLTVASLRHVAWQRLGLNFVLVASPGLLEAAPHTHIATVRVDPADRGALLRRVTDALPNVTGIEVAGVLAVVAGLLDQLAAALGAAGLLTLAVGAVVLVGAVAAGQARRTHEAVILKTLGATRAQLRAAWLVEFGTLGLIAGALAGLVGTLASWGVMRYVMHAGWTFLPGPLAGLLTAALAGMLGLGYLGTARALRVKAAPLLRRE